MVRYSGFAESYPFIFFSSLPLSEEWLSTQPTEIQERVVLGGPCILVIGEELAKAQGKL